MGKESLIKSTAKKKVKKEEKSKKTTAKKKVAKTTTKASPKKTTAKASSKKTANTKAPKSSPKKKSTAKSTPKPAVKKAKPKAKSTAKKPAKKMTRQELLLKSFSPISKLTKPKAAIKPKVKSPSAPPFVSDADPKETARIRSLLLQSHNMADVKAAAKTPAVKLEPTRVEPKKPKTTVKATPAPAPEPPAPPTITTEMSPVVAPDPVSKAAKMLAIGVSFVVLLVLMVSYSNSSKYYIQPKDKAVEIWKGRFSPKDKKFFMVLHGTRIPGKIKDVYSKTDVFPLIFTYYLNKADTLLEVPGLPDFDGIKRYLHDANQYAVNNQMSKTVSTRLNNIERMILLYKADVAMSKGTVASLDSAMKHLKSAQKLITDPTQEQEIQQKLILAGSLKSALKAKAPKKDQ